jgi:hypothetical protein
MNPEPPIADDLLRAAVAALPRWLPSFRSILWVADQRGVRVASPLLTPRLRGILATQARDLPNLGVLGAEGQFMILVDLATIRGPMTARRLHLLRRLFETDQVPLRVLTVFRNRRDLQLLSTLAWGSSKWCLDEPSHLIHLD